MEGSTIQVVAVIGSGTMGRGIAQAAAAAGFATALYDVDPERAEAARDAIEATLEKGVERGKVTPGERAATLERIRLESDLGQAVVDSDLVVEAIPEILDAKLELFGELDAHAPDGAILASNTSSLPVGRLAEATTRADRVLGLHFFNPVHRMRLVEVIVLDETTPDVVKAALGVVRAMGKEPIVVRDSPGFATSRLGLTLGLEAMRMVEEGVASVADIDAAMKLGYNHPMGPLELTDWVGLDVRLAIADHLAETLDGQRFAAPEILRRRVAEGKLGRKSGEGFYRWVDGAAVPPEEES